MPRVHILCALHLQVGEAVCLPTHGEKSQGRPLVGQWGLHVSLNESVTMAMPSEHLGLMPTPELEEG